MLVLDPDIRNYVVMPLVVIMLFVNMARTFVSSLLRSDKILDGDEMKYRQTLNRVNQLRMNGGFVRWTAYASRKSYFVNKTDGRLHDKVRWLGIEAKSKTGPGWVSFESQINIWAARRGNEVLRYSSVTLDSSLFPSCCVDILFFNEVLRYSSSSLLHRDSWKQVAKGGMNPMAAMNPMAMMDMMKGNITFIVPNMIMMNIIQQFFQGFVLVKIPFPLTNRFKSMLQRGVDLTTLDATYTSSLSWYFLLMFGLRGVIKLLLGEEDSRALDEGRAYQMQMGTGLGSGGGMAGAFNAEAAYKGSREMLEIHQHSSVVDNAESRLLGARYSLSRRIEDACGEIGGGFVEKTYRPRRGKWTRGVSGTGTTTEVLNQTFFTTLNTWRIPSYKKTPEARRKDEKTKRWKEVDVL
jgi:hypothetical protein